MTDLSLGVSTGSTFGPLSTLAWYLYPVAGTFTNVRLTLRLPGGMSHTFKVNGAVAATVAQESTSVVTVSLPGISIQGRTLFEVVPSTASFFLRTTSQSSTGSLGGVSFVVGYEDSSYVPAVEHVMTVDYSGLTYKSSDRQASPILSRGRRTSILSGLRTEGGGESSPTLGQIWPR